MATNNLGGGNVTVTLTLNNTTVTAGNGNDTITVNGNSNVINVGNGNDVIIGTGNNDRIIAGNGMDTIILIGQNESVTVGNGNDVIMMTGNNETVNAGNGNDTVNIIGSSASVIGTSDTISLGNGNDVINLSGTTYNNVVTVGNGTDTISISGTSNNDSLFIGNGNDTINITGTTSNDIIMGGGGSARWIGGATGHWVDKAGHVAGGGTGGHFGGGTGGAQGNNIINISGVTQNDLIVLGNGDNKVNIGGQSSQDMVIAGNGNNVVNISAQSYNDMVILGNGNNYVNDVGIGNSVYVGNGNNTVVYNPADVIIQGGNGFNTLLITSQQAAPIDFVHSNNVYNFQMIDLTGNGLGNTNGFGNVLNLNDDAVDNLAGKNNSATKTHETLIVLAGSSDVVNMGSGWHNVTPVIEAPIHITENLLSNTGSIIATPVTLSSYQVFTQGDDTLIINNYVTNTPPVAVADTYAVTEAAGQIYPLLLSTGNVLSNDMSSSGHSLTVSALDGHALVGGSYTETLADGNSITLNANGSFSYVIHTPIQGSDVFHYTVTDGLLTSTAVAVTFNVTDTAPVAMSDVFAVTEAAGQAYPLTTTGNVLSNDVAGGGNFLTVSALDGHALVAGSYTETLADGNSITLNANGSFTYVIHTPIQGSDVFHYTATDGLLASNAAAVTFNVSDTAPVAVSDVFAVTEVSGQAYPLTTTGNVLSNDTAGGGNSLTVNALDGHALVGGSYTETLADGNSITLNANGSFSYVIHTPIQGSDMFHYTATDGLLTSSSAAVTFNVSDTAPVAMSDVFAVTEAAGQVYPLTATGNVLSNDTAGGGNSLAVSALDGHALVGGSYTETLADGNSITLNANGSFSYVIHTPINGSDVFHYTATDGLLASNASAVTFNVTDTAPVAMSDVFAVTEVSGQAYPLTTTGNVLANDMAGGGNALSVSALDGHALVGGSYTETLADGNSITLNANGSFTYIIHTPIQGSDVFHYTATDGLLMSNAAAVTFNVSDTAPVAMSDVFAVTEVSSQAYPLTTTGNVLANDMAGGGNALSVSALDGHALVGGSYTETLADGNSITLNANGSFTYVIHTPINGSDVFHYTATDGLLMSNAVAVTFNVTDTAPVAMSDVFAVTEVSGQAYPLTTTGNVLSNDTAGGGNALSVSALDGHALVGGSYTETLADGNSITLNANGSFSYVIHTPIQGSDVFHYTATDGLLTSSSAAVTFNVSDTAPVAMSDVFAVTEVSGQAYPLTTTGNVLANDTAGGGNSLAVSALDGHALVGGSYTETLADGNSITLNANGSFSYVIHTPIQGSDVFHYTATDGLLTSSSAAVTFNVSDTAPVAMSDVFAVTEVSGQAYPLTTTGNVLANDTAGGGNSLAVSALDGHALVGGSYTETLADGNSITLNANGSFSYVIHTPIQGSDMFHYTATDGLLLSNASAVTFNVSDTAPVAMSDVFAVTEVSGQAYPLTTTGNVLSNDTAGGGNALSVSALDGHALVGGSYTETLADGNSITLNANGSFSYVIHTPIQGSDVFHYTATDGLLASTAVAVTFNVADTAPVAVADTFAVTEAAGQAYPLTTTGNVLANDMAGGANSLTVSALDGHALVGGSYTETLADGNSITLNANGSFSYVIHTPIQGSDVFHYTATDGLLASTAVAVTFNVADTAPVAVADTFAVTEAAGQAYPLTTTGNVLANDMAGGANSLTVSALDGHALIGGSYTETLADGNSITLNADGSFVETINNPINGSDVFSYTATDGLLVSNAATVTFNVSDTAPVAVADTFAVTEAAGQAYPLTTTGNVLANDMAGGGNSLTVSTLDGHALVGGSYTETLADGNSLTLNADGSFFETINAPMNASDVFNYTITDGLLTSNSASVTFNVSDTAQIIENTSFTLPNAAGAISGDVLSISDVQAENGSAVLNVDGSVTYVPTTDFVGAGAFSYLITDETTQQSVLDSMNVIVAPAVQALSEITTEGVDFTLANAKGATSGDPLSLSLVSNAADGVVTFNGSSVTYAPTAGFVGSDSFTYLVTDPLTNQTATDTMNIIVTPATQTLSDITPEGTAFTLANATGATSGDTLSLSLVSNAADGVVTFNGSSVTYAPTAGFVGSDSFTYLVTDPLTNQSATDTMNIIVAPAAQTLSNITPEGTPLTIVNATGATSGDPLSLSLASNAADGAVTFNGNSLTYTPNTGFAGSDSFTYIVTDPVTLQSTTDTMNVIVLPTGQTLSGTTGNSFTLSNPAGVFPGDIFSISDIQALHGTAVLNPDWSITYTPNAGFVGVDELSYLVTDYTLNQSITDIVNIIVDPSAQTLSEITTEGAAFTLANATGATSGDVLSLSIASSPADGTVTFNGSSFTYTPTAGFVGSDSFQYTVTDPTTHQSATDTVNMIVAPAAQTLSETTVEGAAFTLANATGATSGDALSLSIASSPADGTVTFNGSSFTYTPTVGFVGADSFQYTVTDPLTHQSTTDTINMNVVPPVQAQTVSVSSILGYGIALTADTLFGTNNINNGASWSITINSTTGGLTATQSGSDWIIQNPNQSLGNQTVTYTVTETLDGGSSSASNTLSVNYIAPNISLVESGLNFSSLVDSASRIYSWGLNSSEDLGNGNTNVNFVSLTPVPLDWAASARGSAPTSIFSLADGNAHAEAVINGNLLYGWGANSSFEIDAGTVITQTPFPIEAIGSGGTGFLKNIVQVSTDGSGFSAALDSGGHVWDWGLNAWGNLGVGTTATHPYPVEVLVNSTTPLGNITEVAVNQGQSTESFVLALDSSGRVWDWGGNTDGELGLGSTTSHSYAVEVPNLGVSTPIMKVAAGDLSSFALDAGGHVWSWGYNGDGSLGIGSTTNALSPVEVKGQGGTGFLSNIIDIQAGGNHGVPNFATALDSSGHVWDWGNATNGVLGNGATSGVYTTPVEVLTAANHPLSNIVAIMNTEANEFALDFNGHVWAWGYNANGMLGNQNSTNQAYAIDVTSKLNSTSLFTTTNLHMVDLALNNAHTGIEIAGSDNVSGGVNQTMAFNQSTDFLIFRMAANQSNALTTEGASVTAQSLDSIATFKSALGGTATEIDFNGGGSLTLTGVDPTTHNNFESLVHVLAAVTIV